MQDLVDQMKLPKTARKKAAFSDALSKHLKPFVDELDKLTAVAAKKEHQDVLNFVMQFKGQCKTLSLEIVKCAGLIEIGKTRQAERVLSSALDGMEDAIWDAMTFKPSNGIGEERVKLGKDPNDPTAYIESKLPSECLFRARKVNVFKREGLFHLPCTMSHLMPTTRFGLTTAPSLYLAGSIYTAWSECQRPSYSNFCISRFQLVDAEIFDFGLPPRFILGTINTHPTEFSGAYIALWPLMVACMFRAQQPGASFVVEYAISQMLMQWLMDEKTFTGLRYPSTRSRLDKTWTGSCNYVFPTKMPDKNGYCTTLGRQLTMTNPLHFQQCAHSFESPIVNQSSNTGKFCGLRTVDYEKTVYGRVEQHSLSGEYWSHPCDDWLTGLDSLMHDAQ